MSQFTLPKLPFAMDAMEPWMSRETLEFHYGKHHQAYVDKTNQLVQGSGLERSSLEDIIMGAQGVLYQNAAQAWNHEFFWNCLSSASSAGRHTDDFPEIKEALNAFKEVAQGHFASGWAWIFRDVNGKIQCQSMADADNPLRSGGAPILTCDLWEHAYYIDYRNQREKFVEGFLDHLNWDFISHNLRK